MLFRSCFWLAATRWLVLELCHRAGSKHSPCIRRASVNDADSYIVESRNDPAGIEYSAEVHMRSGRTITSTGKVGGRTPWRLPHPDVARAHSGPPTLPRLPRPGGDGLQSENKVQPGKQPSFSHWCRIKLFRLAHLNISASGHFSCSRVTTAHGSVVPAVSFWKPPRWSGQGSLTISLELPSV
ncbi:hypothetical protein BJ166DRAFT_88030 [Pestalotiopsis sp. NC0098]|nr:hypothetical protein BJ166DRAFT_88030 [Pestalotiopsis sp. NC0098]